MGKADIYCTQKCIAIVIRSTKQNLFYCFKKKIIGFFETIKQRRKFKCGGGRKLFIEEMTFNSRYKEWVRISLVTGTLICYEMVRMALM